jgi:hypothetical protein
MALSSRYSSRPTLGATRARQGRFGRDVFWVLLISTSLAALGMFAAWFWRADDLARTQPTPASRAVDSRTFDMPEPAALQTAPTPGPAQK